jgi:endonuclease/exonuclease/phosphatase family metal-dependent hydrolase
LRVVSLNLWNLNRWRERRDHVASWIADLRPDVVGLQEVVRGGPQCQVTWLEEHTGLHASFGGFPRSDGSLGGNATLSRSPIVDVEERELPNMDRSGERRLCLRTTIDSPRGSIQIYNTHLNYLFDDGWVREAQVAAISEFISATAFPACPPVLMGDFNAVPNSTEVRYVKGLTSINGKSFHLFDTFEVMHPNSSGFTWSNRNRYAAENRVPDQRIDYIFVGVRTEDGTGQVLDSRVVFDHAEDQRWPSDHFGVLTDIVFRPLTPEE